VEVTFDEILKDQQQTRTSSNLPLGKNISMGTGTVERRTTEVLFQFSHQELRYPGIDSIYFRFRFSSSMCRVDVILNSIVEFDVMD
jgi:hypothetical protein